MMHPGFRKKRLRFESPVESQDDTGAVVTTWKHYKTLWGQIVPSKNQLSESEQSAIEFESNRYTVELRFDSGISADMRICLGAVKYRIVGHPVDVKGRTRYLSIDVQRYD